MAYPLSLAGKTALVTGASRRIGIGNAICRLLAQAGANVFFSYYRPYDHTMTWGAQPEAPAQLLADLRQTGVRAGSLEADLSDPLTPKRLMDQAEAEVGPVDILVNNATHDVAADIYSLTPESLDQHYAINVRGVTFLCAEFARRHDGRPGGRIINFVSGELVGPMPESIPYIITKGAMDALTISLSGALAPKGISVNAIDPGITDTGWIPPDLHREWTERSFFGRVGVPQDAAHLVLFLASQEGGWITGQLLHSRGGL